jgi:hypothetical protein
MEDGMRYTIVGLTLASALVAGCNRSDATTSGNALTTPAEARDASATPVATEGRATTSRPVDTASAGAVWREVTIPAGTQLAATLDTAIGSDTSRAEEPVTAHLTRPVLLHGGTVLGEGTRVSGVVTEVTRAAKVKGLAHVGMRFNSLTPRGEDQRYDIRTASVTRTAQATKKKDAMKIGAPAAGGAIIGALFGGKKGAAIGAGVGGGAGTAVVLSTRGEEVHLAKGSPITIKLAAPLTVRVRG